MAWGTITIEGLVLRETVSASENGTQLTISGQDSSPPLLTATVRALHGNLVGLRGRVVPVIISDKKTLTGFYSVTDVAAVLSDELNGKAVKVDWTLTLDRVGGPTDVEFETVMSSFARLTSVGSPPAASFWHSPPGSYVDYYTGITVPGATTVRTGADGAITVFRGIPGATFPRWNVEPEDYMKGAASVFIDGERRNGIITRPMLTDWSITNGLVDLRPADAFGRLSASVVNAAGARVSPYTFEFPSTLTGLLPPLFTILQNDPEELRVRLTYAQAAPGRVTVDLSLRRGSRFVTAVMKRHSALAMSVTVPAGGGAAVTGGVRQVTADGSGNRWVVGSMKPGTVTATSIALGTVVAADFFVGHEVGAAAGDLFADLWQQYRGTVSTNTRAVLRGSY